MEILASVNYRPIERIGIDDGKNSKVFKAFDNYLNAQLVVKEIEKKRIGDPARYFAEARAFHASKHDRVVPVHWAADRPDQICIAMPFMAGGSLSDLIKKVPLSQSRLIQVAQDLCEGVAQVHIAKFVHMDIKPTNVLFDEHGRAAITDFGQSIPLDGMGTADTKDTLLYQSYLPPEIARGGTRATFSSDVYQIGLTLLRALNGNRRFKAAWLPLRAMAHPAARDAIANGRFPERTFMPFVALGIRRAIERALSIHAAQRQVGARQLAEELAAVQIKHDWKTELDEPAEESWQRQMEGRAEIIVRRLGALPNARVEIWTEGSSGRRRKAPEAWSKGLRTERQVRMALNRAFRAAVT